MRHHTTGFTVIEVLTVVVVIGILVTIGTFGYMNITRDTRDTERRTGAETLALALGSWARDNNRTPIQTTAGYNGSGEGWIRASGAGYSNNIEAVLLASEHLENTITAPGAANTNNGYALFACDRDDISEDRYGVFTRLEAPNDEDTAAINEWSASCTAQPLGAPYSANYVDVFHVRQ